MSSANGPAANRGASDKSGNAKDGFIAKAAGAVIATGIAWSIYKSFASRKEGTVYVEEQLGFRSSSAGNPGTTVHDLGSDVKASSLMHRETDCPESSLGREANLLLNEGGKTSNKATDKFQGIQNHAIAEGDTLYTISRKYEVSVEALKDVNGLFGDHIVAGQKLIIPNK